MTSTEALNRLADLAGIEPDYWDIWGNHHAIGEDAKERILNALGFPAHDDETAQASMRRLEEDGWRTRLAPVVVARVDHEAHFIITVSADEGQQTLSITFIEEGGARHAFSFNAADAQPIETRSIDDTDYHRHQILIPFDLPLGYHQLSVEGTSWKDETRLIAAPSACYLPPSLASDGKQWGVSAQLYTLKNAKDDWGIGDFADLRALVGVCAKVGASLIGLNPLHTLFLQEPDRASPYSPSSRIFLNPLYINLESVPECATGKRAKKVFEAEGKNLAQFRGADSVDYQTVTRSKLNVLKAAFDDFSATLKDKNNSRASAFRQFCDEHGDRLLRYALFEALSDHFAGKPWQEWPEPYRDARTPEVQEFRETNRAQVEFYKYLQWVADEQLAEVQAQAKDQGLSIGLYRDLAVGCAPDGADAWSDQEAIVQRAKIGCPPDPFNFLGQDWEVPPLHPRVLREMAYEPLIAIIRANMRHAGALRIDHVMGLMHLFWIPGDGTPRDGAYVQYPFDDILAILALESHRQCCLVIGEDLGTVPEGFRERMASCNVMSYKVLYFEKDGDRFKTPGEYPGLSLACVTTHDLATITGFWESADIDLKHSLNLYPSTEAEDGERAGRRHDRALLLRALATESILPDGFNVDDPDGSVMNAQLSAALHQFLARSPATLLLVQVDDLAGEAEQVNVPGTVDERPNWRRRLSTTVVELASTPVALALTPRLSDRSQT